MKTHVLSIFCALMSAVTAQAANIAFVSFHPGDDTPHNNVTNLFTRAPDVGYTELLRNAGHTVTRVLTTGNPLTNALITGADLIIISRSVPSGDYQDNAE